MVQLSWLASGENAGEQEAIDQGYFAQEGLDVTLNPGGANTNGISAVASGAADIGITSSSPSIMLAVSQGIPIQAFATELQEDPAAFYSLAGDPVRTPQDFYGKTVGIQQSFQPIMDAVIAKNNLDKSKINVVYAGTSVTSLVTGQVNVVDAWTVDKGQLAALPSDAVVLPISDAGVNIYSLTYYTSLKTIQNNPGMLEAYIRALAKGWQYAVAHPQEAGAAVARSASGLSAANEALTTQDCGAYMYTPATKVGGWGSMDTSLWQQQIDTYQQIGQFKAAVPTVNQVMTLSILDATTAARMTP